MKKLMMLAAAMTIAGGAYAQDFYDYKASVKNPDLKQVKVKYQGSTYEVATKAIKSTSLYGYVVAECANCEGSGLGWGYLVVANSKDKEPKILPVDLLAQAWDPKFGQMAGLVGMSKTWDAQGYLFAGDGKKQVPWIDAFTGDDTDDPTEYHFSGMMFRSTVELFGQWNTYDNEYNFRDAWMEHAGFGKATVSTYGDWCSDTGACMVLDTLAGSVIGGMWLCIDPGMFICSAWEHTHDVVSGTWSIKRTTKVQPVALAVTDIPFTYQDGSFDLGVSQAVNGAIKMFGSYGFNEVVTVGILDHFLEGYLNPTFNTCGDSFQDLYNDR